MTNLDHAKALIDEQIRKGREFGLDYDIQDGWEAVFCDPNNPMAEDWSKGSTMEEAIIQAAKDADYRESLSSGITISGPVKLWDDTLNESIDPAGLSWRGLDAQIKQAMHCNHQWAHYQGLMNSYDYCTKCDEKRK